MSRMVDGFVSLARATAFLNSSNFLLENFFSEPPPAQRVARVRRVAECAPCVLPLAPLVNFKSAVDAVRNFAPDERLLDRPRLRVGPVESRRCPVLRPQSSIL